MSANSTANPLGQPAPTELAPAGQPPALASEGGANLGDVVRVLKQRRLTIFITFVLLYALVIGITIAVWRFAPLYPSEAWLEVQAPRTDALAATDELPAPEKMRRELETIARKVNNLDLLQEVLRLPEIKATAFYKWYEKQENGFQQCLVDLQEAVGSAPIPETNLIRVSFSASTKAEARLYVDKIVSRFLERFRNRSGEDRAKRAEELRDTLARSKDELKLKREELARFKARTNVGSLESKSEELVEKLRYLHSNMTGFEGQLKAAESQLARLENVPIGQLPINPEMELIVESDPMLRFYKSQVENLDVEMRANLATGLGKNHRAFKRAQELRQGFFEKEIALREELLDKIRRRQLDDLRNQTESLRAMVGRLQDEIEQTQAEQRDLDANYQKVVAMESEIESIEERIAKLDEATTEAESRTRDSRQLNRVVLVQSPTLATKASRPDFVFFLGGGMILSLAGAVGMAFLREFTDQAVRTPLDLARSGQISVIGVVPDLDDEEADVDDIEFATQRVPQSLVAEAFRQIRTNLSFSGTPDSQRSLLVTSPGAEDGKTSVAINLAITLAQSGHRVLLIDCNFRRPRLRDLFPDSRPEGLSNVLIGQGSLDDYVTATEVPSLSLLTTGPQPPTPAELLGSARMRKLLEDAGQQYDRVVLDGPPVLLVSDSLVLGNLVNGAVLVSRAVQNTRGALKRATEQLERTGVRIIGAVLNGAEARPGGYFREQYREFYEYVEEDENLPKLPGGSSDQT